MGQERLRRWIHGPVVQVSLWLLLLTMCRLSMAVNVDSASAAVAASTFELYNADTNQKIVDLINGTVIALSDDLLSNGGPSLNIVVRFPSNVKVSSVQFGLDAEASFHVEHQAPYALCGNRGSADFFSCDKRLLGVAPGRSHTVTATPYKPKRRKRFSFFRTGGDAAIPAGNTESVAFTFAAHNIPTAPPFCGSITSCVDCLNSNCAWAVNFACIDSCTNGVLDSTCYDTKANMSNTSSLGGTASMKSSKALLSQQLCTLAERDRVDIALCDQQRNCTACINTNGTTTTSPTAPSTRCHWISRRTIQNNPSIGYCSIDMCSAPFGFGPCGSTTCPSPS